MFRVIVVLASLLVASAFMPASRVSRSVLKMGYENEVGALPPTGFWDPLGLSKDKDAATMASYREAELKHGRVAMLAVTGYLFQDSFRLPGAIDLDGTTFDSITNGVGAIGEISSLGWLQIIASIGYWELVGWEDRRVPGQPGNFDFGAGFLNTKFADVPNLANVNDKETSYRLREIQNGRLAMLAIMTLITHDIAKPVGEGLFVLHHF